MTEVDLVAKRNWHINLTYGTAAAFVVLMMCVLFVGGWFIYSLRHDIADTKGVNVCRAQVAEDERKATLDVTVGQGELFITAVLDKDNLVKAVTAYRDTVQRVEAIASHDINETCK